MIESRPNFSAGPGAEAPIPLAEPETIPAGFPVIPPEVVRGNDTYIELRKLEDKVAAGETLTVQEACDIQDIVAVELGKHVVNRGKDNERTFYYLPNAGLNEKTGKGVAKTFAASRVDALLRVANPVVDAAGKEPAREIPIAAAKPAPKAPSAFEIALDAVQRVNTARTA